MHLLRFSPDLLALMQAQFGAIARCQLLDHMSEGEVDGLVERRVLERVERGVYRVRGGATPREQVAMAAVLRARPGALVTGPLVLALLGIDGFDRSMPFEVLVRRGRRVTNVDFHWRVNPTPSQVTATFRGLPIATPTVALVDSARWLGQLSQRQLRAGLDAARWRGRTSTTQVLDRARVLGRRDRGARFFLDLLDDGQLTSESEPERDLGGVVATFDPPPEPQVWVTPRHRPDWFWRRFRLGLEYLGRVDHDHEAGRQADRSREDELAARGILIIPITAEDLHDPVALRAWLRVVLDRRARELGVAPPVDR